MDNAESVARALLIEPDILTRIIIKHIRVNFHFGAVDVNKCAVKIKFQRGDSRLANSRLQQIKHKQVFVFAQSLRVILDRLQKFLGKNRPTMRN